jgi:hypothetical protein
MSAAYGAFDRAGAARRGRLPPLEARDRGAAFRFAAMLRVFQAVRIRASLTMSIAAKGRMRRSAVCTMRSSPSWL